MGVQSSQKQQGGPLSKKEFFWGFNDHVTIYTKRHIYGLQP